MTDDAPHANLIRLADDPVVGRLLHGLSLLHGVRVVVGGRDRQVLNDFMRRCTALKGLEDHMLPGRVTVDRPNTGALKAAARDLWSWRVYSGPASIMPGK